MAFDPLTLAELRRHRRVYRSFPRTPLLIILDSAIHYAAIVEAARAKAKARLDKHRQAKAKLKGGN